MYLTTALYAEGRTDYDFLGPLIIRVAGQLCAASAVDFDSHPVYPIDAPTYRGPDGRAGRVLEAVREYADQIYILFIHSDGAGDRDEAVERNVRPAVERVAAELDWKDKRTVPIVPVRETEAWALADGDALWAVFRTRKTDAELGLPGKVAAVESIADPKQTFETAYQIATKRRGRRKASDFLELLGENIRLDCLQAVPSFARFSEELRVALRDLHFIR
jgi:Domain of unknown function (DUF4276)